MADNIEYKGYLGAKQNPNDKWVADGAYTGAKQNPNGKWVADGAYSNLKPDRYFLSDI